MTAANEERASDMVHVVKLGGSLLDLPDAVERFEAWRREELGGRGLLVVGGGATADLVRDADARFKLGEGRAHWLAVEAMRFNAHLVAAILARTAMVSSPADAEKAWKQGCLAVVEPMEWLRREEAIGICIPHRWSFTSDSIAAHLAAGWKSGEQVRLTLLKSTLPSAMEPGEIGGEDPVERATRLGVVDRDFPVASAGVARIELVNLRVAGTTQKWSREVLR